MNEHAFIGMGNNPDGKDIPLGLGMQMAQDAEALNHFSNMTQPQRDGLIEYVQGAVTGDDAKHRIHAAIQGLKEGQTIF